MNHKHNCENCAYYDQFRNDYGECELADVFTFDEKPDFGQVCIQSDHSISKILVKKNHGCKEFLPRTS